MELYLDRRAVKQIRLSAQESIEEGDSESLREDILEAFTEEQVEEIERRLDSADLFEFLTDVLDEWSGDDVDELFELLETQLGEVGIDLKTDTKAAAEDEEEADEPEESDDGVGDLLEDDDSEDEDDEEETSEDSDEDRARLARARESAVRSSSGRISGRRRRGRGPADPPGQTSLLWSALLAMHAVRVQANGPCPSAARAGLAGLFRGLRSQR